MLFEHLFEDLRFMTIELKPIVKYSEIFRIKLLEKDKKD